jgi:hypothetical protein
MYYVCMNRRNRVLLLLNDDELKQVQQLAGLVPLSAWVRSQLFPASDEDCAKELIPLLRKSIERSNKLIPRGEELATGEASARSNDASAETRAPRRLPKSVNADPEEHPRGTPDGRIKPPVDMSKILP